MNVNEKVKCPKCGKEFIPPRITLATQEFLVKYGGKPVQCPNCKHIWGR